MSKTFLQLAAALRQECDGGTAPTSVLAQTGESKRFVDWIAQADEEIQQEHNSWRFMVGAFTLDTVAGDGTYLPADCVTPVIDLRSWLEPSLKVYLLASGVANQTRLRFMDYVQWDATYNTGNQVSGRPLYFTVGHDLSLKLGPTPDAVYRISGEYQKAVTTMAANTDTPLYPAEFHMLPVYLAMMKYGRFDAAGEVFTDGQRLYNKMLKRMERSQLPRVLTAGALA